MSVWKPPLSQLQGKILFSYKAETSPVWCVDRRLSTSIRNTFRGFLTQPERCVLDPNGSPHPRGTWGPLRQGLFQKSLKCSSVWFAALQAALGLLHFAA